MEDDNVAPGEKCSHPKIPQLLPPVVKVRSRWSLFGSRRQKGGPQHQLEPRPLRATKGARSSSVKEIYILQSHDSGHTINCECEHI